MSNYLLFFLFLITGVAGIIFVLFFVRKFESKRKLKLSLNYSLLLVELPKPLLQIQTQEGKIKLTEELTNFENFLGTLNKFKEPIVFEIATPHFGEEIFFYIAVPNKEIDFFQKTIKSFFPGSEVTVVHEDYNIFNPKGVSIVSKIKLKKHNYLPIKTYQTLALSNIDPFESFLSAFNKLEKEGEGLAYQIVLLPVSSQENKKIFEIIKKLREGHKLEEAFPKGLLKELTKEFLKILKGFISPEKKEEKEKTEPKPLEESAIKNLEIKANKPLFKVNIRLVASANDRVSAEKIINPLEASFHQFINPGFNEFIVTRVKGSELKKIFYEFSFRIFNPKDSVLLNTEEITSIFHFPTSYTKNQLIHYLKSRSAPPPPVLPEEGIVLGENNYQGIKSIIKITRNDRRRHIYVIGQTGTGKTTLLKNMVIQDIKNGDGVCFLDPHGDVAQEILGLIPKERIDDVIYFNPGDLRRPIGLNILEYSPDRPEDKTFIINTLIEIIDKLYNLQVTGGPMFEQYLRNALLLIMDNPEWGYTLLDVSRVFVDEDFRNELLNKCQNYPVIEFWKKQATVVGGELSLENMITWITSKLNPFITNDFVRPIIAQSKSALNFREVMDKGKIVIVNLSKGRLGETSAYLLGMILITKFLLSAFSRADIPEEERKDFYLYIDEFQNFAFRGVASILSEARKYRLSMVLAHQYVKQLPEELISAVLGNVGTIISFRIGVEDANVFKEVFKPVFTENDLVNIPNYHAYIRLLINGHPTEPFNLKTLPPEKPDVSQINKIIELSMLKYGKPLEEIQKEISQKYERYTF